MEIATFRVKCKKVTCGMESDVPLLSDFSYGQFLYHSVDGLQIRCYSGLNCEIWSFIDTIVNENFDKKNPAETGRIIQKVIGLIADRPNPDTYFTQDFHCPKCHSIIQSIDDNHKIGLQEYEALTFNNFRSLKKLEKKNWINKLVKEF